MMMCTSNVFRQPDAGAVLINDNRSERYLSIQSTTHWYRIIEELVIQVVSIKIIRDSSKVLEVSNALKVSVRRYRNNFEGICTLS